MPTFIKHTCDNCKSNFDMLLKTHNSRVKKGITNSFCSRSCFASFSDSKVCLKCPQCGEDVLRKKSEIKKNKLAFCSRSCNATYHNKNKSFGYNRSKIEIWVEEELRKKYKDINIEFNDRDAIGGMELDIFVPSINLAFELNGIFHYQPIFGAKKLAKTQGKDANKMISCAKKKIDLCVIDISGLKYFKERKAQKYLDIITEIIDNRLAES